VGRKTVDEISQAADLNAAKLLEIEQTVLSVLNSPNQLNQRTLLPKPDNLALHRIDSNKAEAAMQWVVRNGSGEPVPSYVFNTPTGIKIGPALVTLGKQKLAKKDTSNPLRQRLALDLEHLASRFYPEMTNKEIESRAGTKYEYINARGNESHHIIPIGYMGKIMNKLTELGIEGPVIDEMVRRKMSVGDTASNLASLETKVKPGREFLVDQDKSNVIDIHDKTHALSEDLLEILNLPQQNKGSYRINDFMDDPNVSSYQKQAYAMAVPQAHRLAIQAANLDTSKVRNQKRLIDGMIRLAADNQQSKMNLSPLTQSLLKNIHNQSF